MTQTIFYRISQAPETGNITRLVNTAKVCNMLDTLTFSPDADTFDVCSDCVEYPSEEDGDTLRNALVTDTVEAPLGVKCAVCGKLSEGDRSYLKLRGFDIVDTLKDPFDNA